MCEFLRRRQSLKFPFFIVVYVMLSITGGCSSVASTSYQCFTTVYIFVSVEYVTDMKKYSVKFGH